MTSLKPINAAIPKYGVGTQPFTVLIEGNIGSGKTTFIEHFQKFEDKVCAMTEPVEKWRNFKGYNLLVNKFTKNLAKKVFIDMFLLGIDVY